MESTEHQEWRARQEINVPAALKTALGMGIFFFVMTGGGPWTTDGSLNAAMGREIKMSFWPMALTHFGLAFAYTFAIAWATYRFTLLPAIAAGIATGMVLYAINFGMFKTTGMELTGREFVTFFTHFVYSLFATMLYKALSVPRPLTDDGPNATVMSTRAATHHRSTAS
jgi:predicted anti-sigma-YlaC factor YlaD